MHLKVGHHITVIESYASCLFFFENPPAIILYKITLKLFVVVIVATQAGISVNIIRTYYCNHQDALEGRTPYHSVRKCCLKKNVFF